jgi:hypothetical protein
MLLCRPAAAFTFRVAAPRGPVKKTGGRSLLLSFRFLTKGLSFLGGRGGTAFGWLSFNPFRSLYSLHSAHRRTAGTPSAGPGLPVVFLAFLHLEFVFAMPFLEFLHCGRVIE